MLSCPCGCHPMLVLSVLSPLLLKPKVCIKCYQGAVFSLCNTRKDVQHEFAFISVPQCFVMLSKKPSTGKLKRSFHSHENKHQNNATIKKYITMFYKVG